MTRRLLIQSANGEKTYLEEKEFADELEIQERLKRHPELLPIDDLKLGQSVVVVGMESQLATGRADLVLLDNNGELIIVEFKTGPNNSDFRSCIAQLLDYGSALWQRSVDEFERDVVRPYFNGPRFAGAGAPTPSLDSAMADLNVANDSIGWKDHLHVQLRDGTFRYVAVAQRFTPAMEQTIRYLNETTRSRFAAVEMVRFEGGGLTAFEARVVEGASPKSKSATQATLAGLAAFLEEVTDPEYKEVLKDFLEAASAIENVQIKWGTTGCSIRAMIPGRNAFSVGWVFAPGPVRWLGLSNVTLGWYQDSNGLALSKEGLAALPKYQLALDAIGGTDPAPSTVHGRTFAPQEVSKHKDEMLRCLDDIVTALVES